MFAADLRVAVDRQDRAGFVIDPLNRDEGLRAEVSRQLVGAWRLTFENMQPVHFQAIALQPGYALRHGRVLDLTGHETGTALREPADSEVARFGAAAGQHDVDGRRADRFGHAFSGRLEELSRGPARGMGARRIGPGKGRRFVHGQPDRMGRRRSCVVVEVDHVE